MASDRRRGGLRCRDGHAPPVSTKALTRSAIASLDRRVGVFLRTPAQVRHTPRVAVDSRSVAEVFAAVWRRFLHESPLRRRGDELELAEFVLREFERADLADEMELQDR
jgi:hypothetical protein